jgi:hypothetical protein
MSVIEQLQNADPITQGWFVAGTGLVGVFLVLIVFFISIKVFQKFEK